MIFSKHKTNKKSINFFKFFFVSQFFFIFFLGTSIVCNKNICFHRWRVQTALLDCHALHIYSIEITIDLIDLLDWNHPVYCIFYSPLYTALLLCLSSSVISYHLLLLHPSPLFLHTPFLSSFIPNLLPILMISYFSNVEN